MTRTRKRSTTQRSVHVHHLVALVAASVLVDAIVVLTRKSTLKRASVPLATLQIEGVSHEKRKGDFPSADENVSLSWEISEVLTTL